MLVNSLVWEMTGFLRNHVVLHYVFVYDKIKINLVINNTLIW
jgi:hypothetical protein